MLRARPARTLAALAVLAELAVAATPNAYFLLTFDMLSSPDWPASYANYSLFIASPTHFDAQLVQQVHRDVPGSRVLAYWDTVSVPLKEGCSTGSPMGNNPVQRLLPDDPTGYYAQLRETFSSGWTLRQLLQTPEGTTKTLCYYPGLASYVLTQHSADAIVEFHKNVTLRRGFDGLYLDMLTDDWFLGSFDADLAKLSFDSDGDALPNTVAQLQAQWKSWRPYLVQELRKAVGEQGTLIGNTGGAMSLPGLNGITIEMEWCGGDTTACLDAVEGSRAVAHSPPLDVFWLTQAQMVPPDVQCRMMQQMTEQFHDGTVFAGSDVYDGSHIVCNHTRK